MSQYVEAVSESGSGDMSQIKSGSGDMSLALGI